MKVAGTNSWVPEKDTEKEKDIDKDIDIRVLVSFNGVQRCSTVFNVLSACFLTHVAGQRTGDDERGPGSSRAGQDRL